MTCLQSRSFQVGHSPMAAYLSEIDQTDLLVAGEEQELAYRIQEGEPEARDHMLRANLRLVVRIAREFRGRGLCFEDLVQEGNLGLVRAVEGFDPDMGTRFSTYACYWIRQSIQRALENMSLPVRIPAYAIDLVTKWRRTACRLQNELGRSPTEEEIAGLLNLTKKQLRIVAKALRIYNGINQAGGSEDSFPFGEVVQDKATQTPEANMTAADELHHVLKLLDRLEEREATVLRLRFGLNGQEPMILSEIGARLNLTRERVRQIERDALAKLKELV
jgi:RNA polymerase primary sigma factor